jgi:molybdopterin-guanine dinucleotide biosynthesis protein A
MEGLDAVVLAAGHLTPHDAARAGVTVKALAPIGGTTGLKAVVTALRSTEMVRQLIVVAPREVHGVEPAVDLWVDEREDGGENVLAGLGVVQTHRALVSASDIPFIKTDHVGAFLALVPVNAAVAYPIFERAEFLAAFPHGRTKFARIADAQYTGGSLCLMNTALALEHAHLVRQGFAARKSQMKMASLLGARNLWRFVRGQLTVSDIERRLTQLVGGSALAIRGAHPALAMDYDTASELAYSRARAALVVRS